MPKTVNRPRDAEEAAQQMQQGPIDSADDTPDQQMDDSVEGGDSFERGSPA